MPFVFMKNDEIDDYVRALKTEKSVNIIEEEKIEVRI